MTSTNRAENQNIQTFANSAILNFSSASRDHLENVKNYFDILGDLVQKVQTGEIHRVNQQRYRGKPSFLWGKLAVLELCHNGWWPIIYG